MGFDCQSCLFRLVTLLMVINVEASQVHLGGENVVKSAVFLSPKFELEPGLVEKKLYHNIDFPRGHIALKEFSAEVVDEAGNLVSISEIYFHHLVVARYYILKNGKNSSDSRPKAILRRNNGVCGDELIQSFGLGSEIHKTKSYIPDPYGIEVGNPTEIPDGYEEQWVLVIHAIDTRGVEDLLECTECHCDHYNVTVDEYGKPLRPGYTGGADCCYDQTRCLVREGFTSVRRSLYARYRVKWVDWDVTIVPVKIYLFDVTDNGNHCSFEYDIEQCGASGMSSNGCIHNKKTSIVLPEGGYVIYGSAHQHAGAINSTLYGADHRTICTSMPIYGDGVEMGNESGYIVEMSTCYPQPGTIKISDGERLVLESNYNNSQRHLGVMAIFYIFVVDQIGKEATLFHAPIHETMELFKYSLAVAFAGVAMIFVAMISYYTKMQRSMKLLLGYVNIPILI